tara:strand:+ start:6883 stop:7203 length:321 start_codon:yes stop_codon:yes gene_type:complete
VGAILAEHYPGQPWLHQAQAAVKECVQRCYEQLGGTQVEANGQPGGSYKFAARNKDELLTSQREVADSSKVNPTVPIENVRDPAKEADNGQRTERGRNDGPVSWVF